MLTQENRGPGRHRGSQREREPETSHFSSPADPKRGRKRKNEDSIVYIDRPPTNDQPSFRVSTYPTRGERPEPVSSIASGTVRSVHHSPAAAPVPTKHYLDEDYNEGVAKVTRTLWIEIFCFFYRHPIPSIPLPCSGWYRPALSDAVPVCHEAAHSASH